MKEYVFESSLWVPYPRQEVFEFFSNAHNLERITPPWVRFRVLTPGPIQVQAGTLIEYRLRIHGLPMGWTTEILEWDPPHQFVDVQLRGPYKLWHHTHSFEEKDGGTLCTDRVRYAPRGGSIVNALFVARDVRRIFAYRNTALSEIFPATR